jgi:hypothetical protein
VESPGAAESASREVDAIRGDLEGLCEGELNRGTLLRLVDRIDEFVDALPADHPPTAASVAALVDVAAHVGEHEFGTGGATFGLRTLAAEALRETAAALADVAADNPGVVHDAGYPVLLDVFGSAARPVREELASVFANVLKHDADGVMAEPAIDAVALAKHATALLASTDDSEAAFLDRGTSHERPVRDCAFVVRTVAEYARDEVDGLLTERMVDAVPPEYVAGSLIDVTLARIGRTDLATPHEYVEDFAGLLQSDDVPFRQKQAGTRALGVYAALSPDAAVRGDAKAHLSAALDDANADLNTIRAAISGYEAILEYGPDRLALSDVELLRGLTRDRDGTFVRQDALECLSTVIVEAEGKRYANVAFDGLIEGLESDGETGVPIMSQRIKRVFGQLFAAAIPPQVELTLRAKCRAYVTEAADDGSASFGVDVLREAAAPTRPDVTIPECRATVVDETARWYERLVAAESAVAIADKTPDETVQHLIESFVEVIYRDAESVTLRTVLADQCPDLVRSVDNPKLPSTTARRLCAVVVDDSRTPVLRLRAARLLEGTIRATRDHPFSSVEIGALAAIARFEGTNEEVRVALLSLVPKLLETIDRPRLELRVVNQLSEPRIGNDEAGRLNARMRFDQALRELIVETHSPVLIVSVLERFRQGIRALPMMQLMGGAFGTAEYVEARGSLLLRRQFVKEFVPVVLDAEESGSTRFGALKMIEALVEKTTDLGFDPEVVESLYRLIETPPTEKISDEPLAFRRDGIGAFSTALAAADDVGALVHLASDIANRVADANSNVARRLLKALAVLSEHDPQVVAPYREKLRWGVKSANLDAPLRCRLVDAMIEVDARADAAAALDSR